MADNPRGLPVERALELGIQLADGLSAVHARSIVHRDLKPANLFILAGDQLKICDFGLARDNAAASQRDMLNSQLGTYLYAPPEYWLGKPVSVEPTADLYTTGGILYEMLTGRAPFAGSPSIGALMLRHLTERPSPPRDRSPAVPQVLSDLVLQLLDKSPAGRGSASELHARLQGISDSLRGGSNARNGRDGGQRAELAFPRSGRESVAVRAPEPALQKPSFPHAATATIGKSGALVSGQLLEGHDLTQPIGRPVFSSDGRFLAASVIGGALIWDVHSGRLAGPMAVAGHQVSPELEFSADGGLLLMVSGPHAQLWDVRAGRPAQQAFRIAAGTDLVASPGARFLATRSGNSLLLWDIFSRSTGARELGKRGNHLFSEATFSADGRLVAAASDGGDLCIWETATQKLARRPINIAGSRKFFSSPVSRVGKLLFSPDSRFVIAAYRLWDLSERNPAGEKVPGIWNDTTFAPDSRALAVHDGRDWELWDISSHTSLGSVSYAAGGTAGTLKFFPDGRMIATIDYGGGGMYILNRRTLQRVGSPFGETEPARAIIEAEISPDSRYIATIGYAGPIPRIPSPKSIWTVRLWLTAVSNHP